MTRLIWFSAITLTSGWLGGYWLPIWGGGSLVFDFEGRLRHHAEKPVTRDRIRAALRFLRSVTDVPPLRLESSTEDRLLARHLRSPYVAAVAGDSVAVRANPAARCGARSTDRGAAV